MVFPSWLVHFWSDLPQDRDKISHELKFRLVTSALRALKCGLNFQLTFYGISRISWPILIKFYMYHLWDVGKAAFRFWGRFHQNYGCHGNRKFPLTYNGENDVSTLTPSVLTRSSNLQITRTGIKSWTSTNFGQIGPLPSELSALEHLKISYRHIMGKWCLQASTFICYQIFVKLAGNQDRHKISDEFEFCLDLISHWS